MGWLVQEKQDRVRLASVTVLRTVLQFYASFSPVSSSSSSPQKEVKNQQDVAHADEEEEAETDPNAVDKSLNSCFSLFDCVASSSSPAPSAPPSTHCSSCSDRCILAPNALQSLFPNFALLYAVFGCTHIPSASTLASPSCFPVLCKQYPMLLSSSSSAADATYLNVALLAGFSIACSSEPMVWCFNCYCSS